MSRDPDSWAGWNLARARARDALHGIGTDVTVACNEATLPDLHPAEP